MVSPIQGVKPAFKSRVVVAGLSLGHSQLDRVEGLGDQTTGLWLVPSGAAELRTRVRSLIGQITRLAVLLVCILE